jgi:uncharacterized protein
MPLIVNLRHLEKRNLTLAGELSPTELEVDDRDEMIQAKQPLHYRLEVQMLDQSLLVRGKLSITLDCQCVRCLKPFKHKLLLPDFAAHLPLAGEEAITVSGDCVDLTPILREDTLLEFPQHPLCKPGCGGFATRKTGKKKTTAHPETDKPSSAWAELDKLKFRND